jgi:RNA polymerase sigma factor (sigma-70 family)
VVFHTTRWSLIARATKRDDDARQALDQLCQIYWRPVYAMYRSDGIGSEQARDLTQGLFANLLEREDFHTADPDRGRFRAFLRTCARNWLANERDRERALKRGAGMKVFSLDVAEEEQRLAHEPIVRLDAAAIFERRWAQAVIEQALARLAEEEHAAGRGEIFAILRPSLEGDALDCSWADVAMELQTTEGALRVAVHRLRKRFRERLEAEVRDTLAEPGGDGDELAELLAALRA